MIVNYSQFHQSVYF